MTRSVLVVDDEQDVRTLAVMSLQRIGGYQVRSAGSGSECLAALAAEMPDVVVLDVMMPVMDGPATLDHIRSDSRAHAVPVVFLTAGVAPADLARLTAMPVSGVLRKPFDPLTFPAELAGLLNW